VDVQRRYWQEFIDLKRDALYIEYYHRKTETIDRFLSGFSAITSSAAVAGWVLWRETVSVYGMTFNFGLIWGAFIMLAQVISAVKEYLPYKKRLNSLSSLSNDLNTLAITMENDWFKVSRGLLTDTEINDLHMDLKRRIREATVKSFPNTTLPLDKKLVDRAAADTQLYIESFFGEDNP
jgi:hypothetical protein